jgi:hypothetical protein
MPSALQMGMTRVATVMASLSVLPVHGCSFAFVDTPPAQPTTLRYLDCTSNRAAPVLDTIGAGFYGVSTGIAVSVSEDEFERHGVSKLATIALNLAITALFTAGAVYGYRQTARCAVAKRGLSGRVDPVSDWSPPPL